MDYEFITKYYPQFVEAGILTLKIGAIGIGFSVIVGLICAIFEYLKVPILRQIIAIYTEISRNTPLLVQLFFLYFALPKVGVRLESEICAILGLTFLGGSYMSEAFRSGIESVEKSQFESAMSLGMGNYEMFIYVILPQAFSVCLPALVANVIFLLKETSVFSVVALADLMYVAKDLIGLYYKTPESLIMLVISYLVILLPISIMGTLLERKVRFGKFGD